MPRGIFCICLKQHIIYSIRIVLPFFSITPVFIRQLMLLPWGCLAMLKAPQLFFGADMQPKLYKHNTMIKKLRLKIVDLLISTLPFKIRRQAFHSLHQNSAIP